MKIKIEQLNLTHFKGIGGMTIDFSEHTQISGDNGTGKTTIFDAFTWLLFGKDSHDSASFNIKPLDENNKSTEKVEVEVSAIIDVDGMTHNISRILREKWVKPQGQPESVFQGNETIYSWNEVPLSAKDFKEKVDALFNEELFKLITNPAKLTSLNWKDQRKILFGMVESVGVGAIIESLSDEGAIKTVTDIVNSEGDFVDEKLKASAQKKKIKVELEAIPTRIDEINRNMPDLVDSESVYSLMKLEQKEVDALDKQIADASEANKAEYADIEKLQDEQNNLKSENFDLKSGAERDSKSKNQSATDEIEDTENQIKRCETTIDDSQNREKQLTENLEKVDKDIARLRDTFTIVNSNEFEMSETDKVCLVCGKEIDNVPEQMETLFMAGKREKLDQINENGRKFNEEKANIERQLNEVRIKIRESQDRIKVLQADLGELKLKTTNEVIYPATIKANNNRIAEIDELIKQQSLPKEGKTENLQSQRKIHENKVSDLKSALAVNDTIDKNKDRIKELEEQSKTLGQELANHEQVEYHIDLFMKKQTEMTEGKINQLFNKVSFKMYRQLINGGEEPCCEALIHGVPYSDANTAGQINAGLDIINALCRHYDVTAPVFIDHAESVNEIEPTEGQQVLLIVGLEPELTVSYE